MQHNYVVSSLIKIYYLKDFGHELKLAALVTVLLLGTKALAQQRHQDQRACKIIRCNSSHIR